jgi:hypothetical protein
MKQKNLIILLIVAAVLVAGAWLTSRKNTPSTPATVGKQLMDDVAVDDIASITMCDADGLTTTLLRTDNGWIVKEKDNYPADYSRLHRAVVALTNVKIERAMDLSDKQKKDMHITEQSPRITFRDKDNRILKEITLGDMRENSAAASGPYGAMPTGRFISLDGGKTVVVVSETFYTFDHPTPKGWLNREVCSVAAPDIKTITVSGPDRTPIKIKRDKDNKLTLDGIKDDEELTTGGLSAVENALSYMNFDDIVNSGTTNKLGFDKAVTYEALTKDGLLYTVKLGAKANNGQGRYARISVAYVEQPDAKAADSKDKKDDKAAQDKSDKSDKIAAAKQKAKELNDKFSKWTFVIPSYKADGMTKKRADLVKAKDTKPDAKKTPVNNVTEKETAPPATVAKPVAPKAPEKGAAKPEITTNLTTKAQSATAPVPSTTNKTAKVQAEPNPADK